MLNADLKEFEFTSSFDELLISAVIAVPTGNVCGVVQLVHGLNEHKERYYPFMDYLAEEGFITVIHDCRGHGKSVCSPEDIGFMFRNGGDGFVSDIAQLNKIIRETYPELPVFMIAHGMGSVGARCYIKEHDDELNGLVLLGTLCYSRFSPVTRCIRAVSSKKPGSRFRSEKIYYTIDDTFGKFFEEPENSWRCSDPDAVSAFNGDPLCNFKTTLNGYEEMLRLTRQAYSSNGWQLKNPLLPVRFVSGKEDPCLISQKKFFSAVYSLEKCGYESISHRLFDGMRHDILNEKNSITVWKDIAKTLFSWIDRYNDSAAELSDETDSGIPAETENI